MSIQQDKFTEIANSIRTKKGTTAPIIANDFASEILSIPTGGAVSAKDITFYDYDGTILYAYTIAEFAPMTEMPSPPSHDGLVFQEWNWSLANIKAMNRAVDVGAIYTTASEKSEFDLTFNAVTGLDITMRIYNPTAGATITVEWGDGTSNNATTTIGEKVFTHTYESYGDYTAIVDSTDIYHLYRTLSTPFNMFNKAPSYNCTAVRLGDRCTRMNTYTFHSCYSLQNITISNNIEYMSDYVFYYCDNLKNIIIPKIINGGMGNYCCSNCYTLQNAIIPDNIIMFGSSIFQNCYSLQNIVIPDNATGAGVATFQNCYTLQNITIPDSITSINANVFQNCRTLQKCTFKSVSPPSLVSINAFGNIPRLCIIEVPKGSLQAYQTATNWVSFADHMREAEQ